MEPKVFTPSADLLILFRRGITAAVELARWSPDFSKEALDELEVRELRSASELASVLQAKISQFFALFASRARVNNIDRMPITKDGAFTLPVEHLISNDFIIRPADLSNFLRLLSIELRSYVSRGGRFGGAWGKMAADDTGDLILLLSGDRAPTYAPKEKARVVR